MEDTEASGAKRSEDLAVNDKKRADNAAANATQFAALKVHITKVAFVLEQQQLKM